MFCQTCGNTVNQNAEFCLKCGVNPLSGKAHCYNCGVNTSQEQVACVSCGVNLEKDKQNSRNSNGGAKVFCKSCGNKVHEKAEICTSCGVKPLNGHNYCQHCGATTKAEQEICTTCGVRVRGISGNHTKRARVAPKTIKSDFSCSSYPEYYRSEFSIMESSNEEYHGKFNWFSFILGPIWLFSKGMWQLALVLLGISLVPLLGSLCALILMFLVGRKANYHYINYSIESSLASVVATNKVLSPFPLPFSSE